MAEIRRDCIFYNEKKEECKALKDLYCATEDTCRFCKVKKKHDAEGISIEKKCE